MEKRIELEARGRKPDEILELNLDNCRSPQIAGLTDAFTNVEHLSMINVGLQNLKGFPVLPKLKQLDLSDNRLTGGLETLINAHNLTHLNLSGNKIDDMAALEPLKKLANLKSLDMFNCGVTAGETYREKMFELLPQMQYLDGFDKDDIECSEGSENGEHVEDEDSDDEGTDEEDHSDLVYLQGNHAAQDEDETEDFEPGADVEEDDDVEDDDDDDDEDFDDEQEKSSGGVAKGTKRKLEDDASK